MKKKRIISLDLSTGKYSDFLNKIKNLAQSKMSSYVCVANVHMLVEAYCNEAFKNVINSANLVTPDGMPLVYALKKKYNIIQDRVAGMDLLPDLIELCEREKLSIYFYGGSEVTINRVETYCKDRWPNINISGLCSPPFRELTEDENAIIVRDINNANPNIVFVALGCPKQEKWMNSMLGKIDAVMIGIGGALPVLIGEQSRCPNWMQKNSLEWLYRLYKEPRRLFKRYFYTNCLFIYLMLKEQLKK